MIGGFVIHLSGYSQVPENPPGPPQASPSILAHTLQHLQFKEEANFEFSYAIFLSHIFHE